MQLGEILNQGGFSVVHKGSWHGTRVAVKKLFDPNISHELLAEFDNEVQKLEMLRHLFKRICCCSFFLYFYLHQESTEIT